MSACVLWLLLGGGDSVCVGWSRTPTEIALGTLVMVWSSATSLTEVVGWSGLSLLALGDLLSDELAMDTVVSGLWRRDTVMTMRLRWDRKTGVSEQRKGWLFK